MRYEIPTCQMQYDTADMEMDQNDVRNVCNICTKANRTLCFLRRNLYSCPQDVKKAAYKGTVHPVLENGSSVWDPQSAVLQEELESEQKRGARFVTGNYDYETGSITGILGHPQEKEERQ